VILVESQYMAVDAMERGEKRDVATGLASSLMTELEFRMEKEGFGEQEVKEQGDFTDDAYGGFYEDYRWEYEVEKVDIELPDFGEIMGLAGEGASEAADAAGVDTGGAAPTNDLAALGSLGLDFSFLTDQVGSYLREARVRVCYSDGRLPSGAMAENCVELVSHLVNPTGQVTSEEEGDDDDVSNGAGGAGFTPSSPLNFGATGGSR